MEKQVGIAAIHCHVGKVIGLVECPLGHLKIAIKSFHAITAKFKETGQKLESEKKSHVLKKSSFVYLLSESFVSPETNENLPM